MKNIAIYIAVALASAVAGHMLPHDAPVKIFHRHVSVQGDILADLYQVRGESVRVCGTIASVGAFTIRCGEWSK